MHTGGKKTQRAACPLEGIHRGPAFPHDVNERGMERIRGPHPITQQTAFLLGLLALGRRFRMGPLHAGHNVLICR